jgi:serine protease Do
MSTRSVLYLIVIGIVAGASALIGTMAGGVFVFNYLHNLDPAPAVAAQPTPAQQVNLDISTTTLQTTIIEAVETVAPTVVTVVGDLAGRPISGSGVVISPEGYILTNNHVVEGTSRVVAVLSDGTELPAEIVGTDIYADLAVLSASGKIPAVAQLGNSDSLKPGETVIAIGSPLGDFVNTVTVGVISATGRSLDTGNGFLMEDLIQTDAAINQGNSGGPLVNLAGDVVGINTLVVRGSGSSNTIAEGLGFAIPINTARIVSEQIVDKGYFARPQMGIRWQAITPRIARVYGLPVQWGAYISTILPGSPAAISGLSEGDIITYIDDIPLDEDHTFINTLFRHEPGEQVTIKVVRNREQITVNLVLGESR